MTSLYDESLARPYYTKVAHEKVDKEGTPKDYDEVIFSLLGIGLISIVGGATLKGLDPVVVFIVSSPFALLTGLAIRRKWGNRSGTERDRRIDRIVRDGVAAYQAGDEDAVSAVHDFTLQLLRRRVEEHRARTLGPSSEWELARAPLATALDEVEAEVAYWDERIREEPDSELASLQLRTARDLEAKLRSALEEVDGRAEVLRQFYHRCEAKLAVMDRSNTDLTKVRRLEELSGRADSAIAHAQRTVEALAQHFLAEAQNIASALGSADHSQLSMLAGAAPVDNIDFLADKIHESSERDRNTIQQLEKALDE